MKKLKLRKIFEIVLWVFGLGGVFFLLSFVNKSEDKIKGKNIQIEIQDEEMLSFVSEENVLEFLNSRHDTLIQQPLGKINFYELEKSLNAHPAVSRANIAVDINGSVKIKVKQRNPLVRIINLRGESFYIDEEKKIMPLSENYAARVPVASGVIPEWYSLMYGLTIDEIKNDSALASLSCLDDIFGIAEYLTKDSMMGAIVHQIHITKEREIELYPAIGQHKIIFGNGEEIEEKFLKLKTFYREGLSKLNTWDSYSVINLKFKNQVVCTKK